MATTKRHLTYQEAADMLGVSKATLHRMIQDGRLVPERIPRPSGRGTVPRIPAQQVEATAA